MQVCVCVCVCVYVCLLLLCRKKLLYTEFMFTLGSEGDVTEYTHTQTHAYKPSRTGVIKESWKHFIMAIN